MAFTANQIQNLNKLQLGHLHFKKSACFLFELLLDPFDTFLCSDRYFAVLVS